MIALILGHFSLLTTGTFHVTVNVKLDYVIITTLNKLPAGGIKLKRLNET